MLAPMSYIPIDGYGNSLLKTMTAENQVRMALKKLGDKADRWAWELQNEPPIGYRDALMASVKEELERLVRAGTIEPIRDGDISTRRSEGSGSNVGLPRRAKPPRCALI